MCAVKFRYQKGLFITFEGIKPTIFDSQVGLHARDMKKHGIEFEIWAFETWPGMYNQSNARLEIARALSQSKVRLFRGLFFYIPLSEIINTLLLIFHLIRLRPEINFIHARADYSAAVCGLVGTVLRIPVIWDCRGDAEAEFRTAYQPANIFGRVFKSVYLNLIRLRTTFDAWSCTRAIFVSEGLRNRKWKKTKQKLSDIIPTSVSQEKFFFSEELRQTFRGQLALTSEMIVLLYSGGIVGYQNFAEYVRMVLELYDFDPTVHFLVVTPHLERASRILDKLPDDSYTLRSAAFDEMNSFYNAADFGMLLRKKNDVNNVASPTKFGEYCLTGLPIIMNGAVTQSTGYAKRLGNYVPVDQNFYPKSLKPFNDQKRKIVAKKAASLLSRRAVTKRYQNIYDFHK